MIDQWVEKAIWCFVIFILVFGPLATGAVRTLEFLIIQGAVMAIAMLWLIRLWLGENHRLLIPPISWAVLAFTGYVVMRYFQANVEYTAREELIRILIYAFLFFAVVNHMHHQESTQWVSFVLIFVAMGIAGYAIYQFATNSDRVWHFIKPVQYMKRGSGTYICPNHLAGFLEMILPLGLTLVFMGKMSHVTKVFIGYASLVILAGIGVSISRGGWIATGLAMVVFFAIMLRKPGYRIRALVFLVLLIGLGVVFVRNAQHSQKRFSEMFVAGQLEDIRFRLWRPAVLMWEEHPWLGVGPGHFDLRFRQYRPDEVQMRPDRVHNDYLNTLADYGVVGVLLVASAFVLLYMGVFKTWKYVDKASSEKSSHRSNKPAFVLGASLGLMAILLHSVVDFNMHIPANAILAVILMALLSSHLRFATDSAWFRCNWPLRILVSLVCLFMLGLLGMQGLRRYQEYQCLQAAEPFKEFTPERIPHLEKAYAVEPMNYKTAYEIGEALRVQSWNGDSNYKELAQKAMLWFERSMKLNPFDGYSQLRYGMCLHWLGRHQEAGPYFEKALKLDPNGYYMVAHQGWHLVQLGDYAGAKPWFERSLALKPHDNPIAVSYLNIIKRRLSATSSGK